MADIYRRSALTIIMAVSDGATVGLLDIPREPSVALRLRITSSGLEGGQIMLKSKKDLDSCDSAIDPTETRAWCLQEAILSPKCLVFSSSGIFWSCQEVVYADINLRTDISPPNRSHFVRSLPPMFSSGREKETLQEEDGIEI